MIGTGPVGVGVIGAGVISSQYLDNLTVFPDLKVLFVADIDLDRAKAQAEKYGIPESGSVAELLAHPEIEIVVNLTIPAAHVEVALQALAAGKNVWTEKPFALDLESGRALLDEADRLGLRVATAPDTFLGAGLQTGFRLIEDGTIGTPLTALALMQSPGPDSWHPNPEFLFQYGGGPLFDIGSYYLTTLVNVFGPASRVTAAASTSRAVRVIGAGPRAGEEFDVTVPTHHGALIEFESGASAQTIFSFESHRARTGFVEVSGTKATLAFPDPNNFEGESVVFDVADPEGRAVPAVGSVSTRGTGVAEMAQAMRAGRPERATGAQAFHVLDIMVSIAASAARGESVAIGSSFQKASPVPEDWDPKVATL
ncbi:Gfo/Idh/MocA family protein [Glaciihabitans sp. dw_435]|uniref:Gfo/Idh/MocA family protein n=1 Tax=Glaciihabitans sp. dw_435 TaxID=2720081 RepID=UPI001BD451ED|nr:Gfo/Idh/MocA family oxidoreductase [Glaciihabitans sp. dw_435]